jgi:hypothetical protein
MLGQAGVAVCAAAVAGMLLMPAQLSARGAAGHPGGSRPIVRPMHRVHPPFVRHVPKVDPFAHHHHAPFAHRDFRDRHEFRAAARRHHRGIWSLPGYYGYGLPLTYAPDDTAFYGTYYDPSDVTGSIVVPPYTVPSAPVPALAGLPEPPVQRAGCRSQTVAVPSPSGAERSVTITRC